MALVNGLYVVQGEANAVLALLRKFRRTQTRQQLPLLDEHNPLLRNFADLRDVLNKVNDLSEIQFDNFISPFLEVIKSEATDGPITARALSAIEKFISYGLLSFSNIRIAGAVQSISDAVTKAKFIGTSKAGIDECVLFQILQTLRSLVLSPGGRHLSNATVCEILQCCFRIGLEQLLPELLRVAAESALADMCRHLFAAMPTFEQDIRMGLKELMRFSMYIFLFFKIRVAIVLLLFDSCIVLEFSFFTFLFCSFGSKTINLFCVSFLSFFSLWEISLALRLIKETSKFLSMSTQLFMISPLLFNFIWKNEKIL